MENQTLLNSPINKLNVSKEFKDLAIQHDFRNLQDILNWPANILLMHSNFTYHIYNELLQLLKADGLVKLLRQ